MNTRKVILATVMACAFSALTAPAFADEVTVGNNYARLSGGVILPEDIDSDVGGPTVSLSFKSGWTVSAAVGTWINDNVSIEGELGYLSADLDEASALGVSIPVEGDFTSTLLLANVGYHLSGKNASFDPYVGAGVGGADSKISVDSVGGIPVGASDTATDFAAQVSAGLNFHVSSGVTVGAQYRYLYIDSGDGNTDGFSGHNLTANVSFAF